jgi:hypothetical protein
MKNFDLENLKPGDLLKSIRDVRGDQGVHAHAGSIYELRDVKVYDSGNQFIRLANCDVPNCSSIKAYKFCGGWLPKYFEVHHPITEEEAKGAVEMPNVDDVRKHFDGGNAS